jgi:hypothetical protein
MQRTIHLQPEARDLAGQRTVCHGLARRRAWKWRALLWCFILSFTVLMNRAAAQEPMPVDYQVKAAFLINFPKYVEWPAGVFPQTNSPITVGIMGDENVANEFATMIKGGKMIAGRPVVLKRIENEDNIGADCHVLFISASLRQRIPAIVEKVKRLPVLTVGEEGFLEHGGSISLMRRDRKIRFQLDLNAAREAGLKISSRLMDVADSVHGKP